MNGNHNAQLKSMFKKLNIIRNKIFTSEESRGNFISFNNVGKYFSRFTLSCWTHVMRLSKTFSSEATLISSDLSKLANWSTLRVKNS